MPPSARIFNIRSITGSFKILGALRSLEFVQIASGANADIHECELL